MRIFSVFVLVLFLLTSCQTKDVRSPSPATPASANLPWPLSPDGTKEILLDHVYFQISYNESSRLPAWVSYQLKAENLKRSKSAKRKNKFFADPLLLKQQISPVMPDDYDGDKYDRGHMAPSDDFSWDQAANDATFVMTNMAPQVPSLNRGSWKKLEGAIRKWACTEGELRVVTGPILLASPLRMTSKVPVPQKFFKVILDETPPRKAIGFIYSQEDTRSSMQERAVAVSEIERATGLRFFADIPALERASLEKGVSIKNWIETDCMPGKEKKGS